MKQKSGLAHLLFTLLLESCVGLICTSVAFSQLLLKSLRTTESSIALKTKVS